MNNSTFYSAQECNFLTLYGIRNEVQSYSVRHTKDLFIVSLASN